MPGIELPMQLVRLEWHAISDAHKPNTGSGLARAERLTNIITIAGGARTRLKMHGRQANIHIAPDVARTRLHGDGMQANGSRPCRGTRGKRMRLREKSARLCRRGILASAGRSLPSPARGCRSFGQDGVIALRPEASRLRSWRTACPNCLVRRMLTFHHPLQIL